MHIGQSASAIELMVLWPLHLHFLPSTGCTGSCHAELIHPSYKLRKVFHHRLVISANGFVHNGAELTSVTQSFSGRPHALTGGRDFMEEFVFVLKCLLLQ